MMRLLGSAGAERAERSLSTFLAQVRAATPNPSDSQHQLVLRTAMQTLVRRCTAARIALRDARTEADRMEAALASRGRAVLTEIEALSGTASPAQRHDIGARADALVQRNHEIQERRALLSRALAWLDDVRRTTEELRLKDAETDHGVDAPGLLRTLTELGALLTTLTDAARAEAGEPWAIARVPTFAGNGRELEPDTVHPVLKELVRKMERGGSKRRTPKGKHNGRTV